jgi:primary-amine oxidase
LSHFGIHALSTAIALTAIIPVAERLAVLTRTGGSLRLLRAASRSRRYLCILLFAELGGASCRQSSAPKHPMDPLDADEMRVAQTVLRTNGLLSDGRRVMLLDVHEPPKADVLSSHALSRAAFAVIYDATRNVTGEAIVDVGARKLRSWHVVPMVQPALDGVDAVLTDSIVRANDGWRAALVRRGIDPQSKVTVFAWSAGQFGGEDSAHHRLVRAVTYLRAARDNEMARPVEGLTAMVDLSAHRVVHLDDDGAVPVADATSERDAWRALASPTTTEPATIPWSSVTWAGPGPRVDGHAVQWRRWRFHIALRPREGLVLYAVGFDDGTRVRSVLYRASLSEMVVPYGDPGSGWYFRNSFDLGELGMGAGVAALVPGVDCPTNATLIDATIADVLGQPRRRARAIALFERDGGLAWKHGDLSRRARELVVFSVSRLGNYDYGFEWIFHEDGTIEHRVLLTGIMTPKGVASGHGDSLASLVAPGVAAVHHQHFFNYRLDVDVDGSAPNQVVEVETHALAGGTGNPHGGGFAMEARPLATEQEARRQLDAHSGRRWRVINTAAHGALGSPTGFELVPGANANPFAAESSSLMRRAGFLQWQLWATPYVDSERFAAGDYPNQSPGGSGLARWSSANRSLVGGDVVLWYTLGITHNPRPEDWPVMPVHEAGFRLMPVGFFDRNPVLARP